MPPVPQHSFIVSFTVFIIILPVMTCAVKLNYNNNNNNNKRPNYAENHIMLFAALFASC